MNMELTELILSQGKTFAVMLSAGVLIESMWQVKSLLQRRVINSTGKEISRDASGKAAESRSKKFAAAVGFILEIAFWLTSVAVLCGFLYYCAYGKPSLHAAVGFFMGLLLWKKILSYAILFP